MTPTETVAMLAQARALFPGMTLVQGMPELWHEALRDCDGDDVRAALVRYAQRETRIVTVADLRRGAASIAEERRSRHAARAIAARTRAEPPPEWYAARAELAARARARQAADESLDAEPDPTHDRYR